MSGSVSCAEYGYYVENPANGLKALFCRATMNLLMIIIILFAIMVSVCISYMAWKVSSDKPSGRRVKKSGAVKEPKDLPDL